MSRFAPRTAAERGQPDAPAVAAVRRAVSTPGRPMERRTRADLEPRFGHDLSAIRVHTDTAGEASARAVDARAYTVGEHIVFGRGQYAPGTAVGRALLAHEVAHVVTPRVGRARAAGAAVSTPGDPAERAADRAAESALRGAPRFEAPRFYTLAPAPKADLSEPFVQRVPRTRSAGKAANLGSDSDTDSVANEKKQQKKKHGPQKQAGKSRKKPTKLPVNPFKRLRHFLSIAATRRAIRALTDQMKATRNSFLGRWRKGGIASGAVDKSGKRALQALNQLSQLLLNEVRRLQKENQLPLTQEIEMMAVNDRILVSANDDSAVQLLQSVNLRQLVTQYAEMLRTMDLSKSTMSAEIRKAVKISLLGIHAAAQVREVDVDVGELATARAVQLENEEAMPGIIATLGAMIGIDGPAFTAGGSAGQAGNMIEADAGQHKIITVDAVMTGGAKPTSRTHAEQNLVLALVKSRYKKKVFIAGGKRPCVVCWLTMSLANLNGYDIEFNQHPGGVWEVSTEQGLRDVAQALGYTKESKFQSDLDELGLANVMQYVTNVVGEPTTEVDDMTEAIEKKLYRTDMPSDSDSDVEAEPLPAIVTRGRRKKGPPVNRKKLKKYIDNKYGNHFQD